MNTSLLLETRSITKSFDLGGKSVSVLRGIDFHLRAGEMVAIMGASGVGKSTFLHILGTLEQPTQGEVVYYGDQTQGLPLHRMEDADLAKFRNRELGFIFQFHHLLPELSAVENVMLPAWMAGHSRRKAESNAKELLRYVGLEDRFSHRPSELSGGEQQRVAIARAIILRPKLILADEMTGNLDSENGEKIVRLIEQLNRDTGVSVVLVTHDLKVAGRMNRTILMQDGKLSN